MIDKTAVIHPSAELADDVTIGAYAVIGPKVKIDSGTWVGPHAVVNGPTQLGKNNHVFQFASIGEIPQDLKYKGEETELFIGDGNTFRECVTINRGTVQDKAKTVIGSDNLFMAYVHVGHDSVIGNHNVFANSSAIAGHVLMGDHIHISAFCGIHQFCQIGSYAFISHASLVSKDVPPYVMVTGGTDVTVCGLNTEGLKRHGFEAKDISLLRKSYKVIYREGNRLVEAIESLKSMNKDIQLDSMSSLIHFLESSTRGIIR